MFSDVYVVFEKCADHWWSRFLHAEISHCYLLIPSDGGWLVLNRHTSSTEVFAINDISDIIRNNHVVCVLPVSRKRPLVSLNTCVSLVKEYIGLKSMCITPYQLYKRLNHGKLT